MRARQVKPRKRPRTPAGVSIADAIVTAAEQLLAEAGMSAFSTNRVAVRAGVSVGSLYQYFPNKEALLAEVARRLEARAASLVLSKLEACRELPLRRAVGEVVDVMLSDGLSANQVRQVIRREVPAAWISEVSREVDRQVQEALAAELLRREDVRRDVPARLLAWIAAHSVELLVEHAVLNQPDLLQEPGFREQLVLLVEGYLRRSD